MRFLLARRIFGLVGVFFTTVSALTFNLYPDVSFAAPVGVTAGSFSVDHNGGANYTLLILGPPGTAGMVPHIALGYTKQVENPIVGVGFSISGLSVITRCGQTRALDGQKGGVSYDSNDRFCLDGQRLLAISGTYGANGAEYRTERETFGRIISYGTQGNGPQYFRITTKDGIVMEYGVTADSRIEAQGRTDTSVRL